jgi:hypothetical protein
MKALVLLVIGASGAASGCHKDPCRSPPLLDSQFTTAAVQEADGRIALYSGFDIRNRLTRTEDIDTSGLPSFLRVRVPPSLAEEVRQSPRRQRILSLEEPYPGLEITYHTLDLSTEKEDENYCVRVTGAENWLLVPGQPWLSGHVRISLLGDGEMVAGAHIIKHSGKLPGGGAEIYEGFFGCSPGDPTTPDCPALKYDSQDPCRWPPLPPSWMLVPLMGQPTDLDELCGRKPRSFDAGAD